MKTAVKFIQTMRPGQWVKNLFVFAPAVFAKAHTASEPVLLLHAALGTAVFIMLAGAVYVMNDVLDMEKDKMHPVRRLRPIPSGQLSVESAIAGGLLVLVGAFGVGLFLGTRFTLTALAYLGLNVAYSTTLKHRAWLDVGSIATGFLLRVLAGSFAIALTVDEISPYLIGCTFLVALFLALGKRRHEIALDGGDAAKGRSVLQQYRPHQLDVAMVIVAILTFVGYVLYTMAPATRAYFGTWQLVFTTPFVLAGILRFWWLIRRSDDPRSPTDAMIRDAWFVLNIVLWGIVVAVVVYV